MKRLLTRAVRCMAVAAVAAAIQAPAWAQTPVLSRPARIVVTVPPGGSIDMIARRVALKLAPVVGQPVIVDNKPGASGTVGVGNIIKSPADGSTLILAAGSTITVLPHLLKKMPYDTAKDLTPLLQIGVTPLVLLVNNENPAKDLAGFVAAAKARPGALSYGSYGSGSLGHLIGEAFKSAAGVQLTHIPYKGCAAAINDLIGGQLNAVVCDIGSAASFLQAGGRLRGLAITGTKRVPAFATIPSFPEAGYPTLGPMVGWLGIFAPAKLPKPTATALVASFNSVMQTEDMRSALAQIGYAVGDPSSANFAKIVRQDTQIWGALIQSIGGVTLD